MESGFSESEVTLHSRIPVCIVLRRTVSETRLTGLKVPRMGEGVGGRLFIRHFRTVAKSYF